MRLKVLFGAVFLAACGAHPGSRGAALTTAPIPCAVPVPSPDSLDWKLVQAEGFTFCVPPGWRASGARGWRGDGAGIDWAVGRQPQSTYLRLRRFPVGIRGPNPEPRHLVEIIGGESAELWEGRVQDAEYTAAQWTEKRVYFEGKANGPQGAEVELMIFRTVRFNATDLGT